MIKTLNLPESQLSIQQRLLYICKKPGAGTDHKPQIDFLLLDRQVQQLQQIQSKTCQQIVQFVDQHLQKFIQLNGKFKQIQSNVQQSQLIINKLIPKLDAYKTNLFSPQSKIQQFVTNYQKKIMQRQLIDIAREQTQFLLAFIKDFQNFININIEQLSQRHKYNIVRLLKKYQYIKCIIEHPLIKNASTNGNQVSILLSNIGEELEFYLSEQLSRVAGSPQLKDVVGQNEDDGPITLLEEIGIWYGFMGKLENYYDIIQESIIGRKLSTLEFLLVSHKQNLIIGSQEHIIKQFFSELFNLVQQFPKQYPKQRILKILYKFLTRKQINFIYSYVVPTFPISYSAYKQCLPKIKNQALRSQLQRRHGWNLKFWADLRIKSIMDRSGKDKEKTLSKWLEIVFKKNFMIYGVKNYMIKLAFLLVNRYCAKFQEEIVFSAKNLNESFNQLHLVNQTTRNKLLQAYEQQLNEGGDKKKHSQQIIKTTVQNINQNIRQALKKWIIGNMSMTINSCKSSLQPYKSFVMNIISKKDRQKNLMSNTQQNILKPLRAYFKNNPQISKQCCLFLEQIVLGELQAHYDQNYAKQIYNYCFSNISTEQMKLVMQIVSIQRQKLFQLEKQRVGSPTKN